MVDIVGLLGGIASVQRKQILERGDDVLIGERTLRMGFGVKAEFLVDLIAADTG